MPQGVGPDVGSTGNTVKRRLANADRDTTDRSVTWEQKDEWTALSRQERDTLATLARGPLQHGDGRNIPEHFRNLIGKGLAFQAHGRFTITEKGVEVAERVG